MEPLPPVKEVEYRCYIGKAFDELSGQEFITFAFETAKEFSSFRYEIAVRYKIAPNHLEFKVLGMTATRTMMPAFGTARSILKLPLLPLGVYTVIMIKSDGTENMFSVEITRKGFQILPPIPRKRFIDLIVEDKAVTGGARITSTVSKTPPPPLIPRTIQKRQPPPPTPEELAILESLKTETPEERDAREEMELFGGAKKVSKKDLEEVEKDIEKLSVAPAGTGGSAMIGNTAKAGATKPIEEVQEVPATAANTEKRPGPAAKPVEATHSEPKQAEPKATDHTAPEARTAETKATDAKASEGKGAEPKASHSDDTKHHEKHAAKEHAAKEHAAKDSHAKETHSKEAPAKPAAKPVEQEVKALPKGAKPVAKPAAKVESSKPSAAAKAPATKASVAKPAAKPSAPAKKVEKTAKSAAKPAAKSSAKPAAKAAKPAAKTAAKPAAKKGAKKK